MGVPEVSAMTKEVLDNSLKQFTDNMSDDAVQKFVFLVRKLAETDKSLALKCLGYVLG